MKPRFLGDLPRFLWRESFNERGCQWCASPSSQLLTRLIETDNRTLRIIRLGVEIQGLLHRRNEPGLTAGMHQGCFDRSLGSLAKSLRVRSMAGTLMPRALAADD